MSKQLFESQWKATKAALCEGSDLERNQDGSKNETKKAVLAHRLSNSDFKEQFETYYGEV